MVNQDTRNEYEDKLAALLTVGAAYAKELVREQIILLNNLYDHGEDYTADEIMDKSEELFHLFIAIDTLSDRIGMTMEDIMVISATHGETRGGLKGKFTTVSAKKLLTFPGWSPHIVSMVVSTLSQPVMVAR